MGRGTEGEWEEEEPVQDPGPPCRREVQPGSTSFLSTMDVLEGWSRLRKTRGAGRGERLEVEGLGVAGGAGRGGKGPLFLPTPSFMASAEED